MDGMKELWLQMIAWLRGLMRWRYSEVDIYDDHIPPKAVRELSEIERAMLNLRETWRMVLSPEAGERRLCQVLGIRRRRLAGLCAGLEEIDREELLAIVTLYRLTMILRSYMPIMDAVAWWETPHETLRSTPAQRLREVAHNLDTLVALEQAAELDALNYTHTGRITGPTFPTGDQDE